MLQLLFLCLVWWPVAVPNTGAAAQTMTQRNVLPPAAGGRAGATSALVNGRTFSNTRVMGEVCLQRAGQLTPTCCLQTLLLNSISAQEQFTQHKHCMTRKYE
jgi:hypothetical protein